MSSEKQIAANRMNARRSTGPNTSGGKARSRMNAWKHGLRAEKVVIAGEDAEDLQAIQRELWEEHQPAPGMESLLVERLAHYAWRMRRALVFEAALLEEAPIEPFRLGWPRTEMPCRLCCVTRWRWRMPRIARCSSCFFCKIGGVKEMGALLKQNLPSK